MNIMQVIVIRAKCRQFGYFNYLKDGVNIIRTCIYDKICVNISNECENIFVFNVIKGVPHEICSAFNIDGCHVV